MPSAASARAFQAFHFLCLSVVHVIIAEKMQKAMNHEMGEMVLERLAFKCRLARDRLAGKNNVAQHRFRAFARRDVGRPGKDSTLVGLSMPRHCDIDGAHLLVVGEDEAEFGLVRHRQAAATDAARSDSLAGKPLQRVSRCGQPPALIGDVDIAGSSLAAPRAARPDRAAGAARAS